MFSQDTGLQQDKSKLDLQIYPWNMVNKLPSSDAFLFCHAYWIQRWVGGPNPTPLQQEPPTLSIVASLDSNKENFLDHVMFIK